MIVKIGHGSSIMGALSYNFQKVDKGSGQVLHTQNIQQSVNGEYSLALSYRSFEPYLIANRNTEKPSLHISINPDAKDTVDDQRFIDLAETYMREMGYGSQPYIVFKHTDIERTHIHIVSTNVNEHGRKISDAYEHRRSMDICRKLEKRYGLIPPAKEETVFNEKLFRPVDYKQADIKSQIASVLRYLPGFYHYQNLGGYNALLSLFNIQAYEVSGELNGKQRQGLVYFAVDTNGQKASNPFKASLFREKAGHAAVLVQFEKSKAVFKDAHLRGSLKSTIEAAMHTSNDRADFTGQLKAQGINVVVRSNTEGRIYGITFIDHTTKSVWNGSQLGKGMAANVFEQWWNAGLGPNNTITDKNLQEGSNTQSVDRTTEFSTDDLNLNTGHFLPGIMDILLQQNPGEDHEEQAFAYRMRKKKRKNK